MSRDRFLSCESCGVRFVWTQKERAALVDPPSRCPACRLLLPGEGRRRGVVKFYNARHGWGFITPTVGEDVFVHRSGLADGRRGPLRDGDLVEFTIENTARGPQAVHVRRLVIEPVEAVQGTEG